MFLIKQSIETSSFRTRVCKNWFVSFIKLIPGIFQLFPAKTLVINTFENLQSLFEHLKSNGTPSSALLILNHAFKHNNIVDDTRSLNEIIVRDTVVIVNQVSASQ